MTKKRYRLINVLLIIILFILLFELIRDSMRLGDFVGYVNAGNLVLTGQNIYSDFLNTWPPFFSIFSVPIALGDLIGNFFVRFIWLLGSIIAMYYVVRTSVQMSFNKTLNLIGKGNIIIQESMIVIPLLILLRFIMDNLSNLQINIYMLLCSLLTIVFFY